MLAPEPVATGSPRYAPALTRRRRRLALFLAGLIGAPLVVVVGAAGIAHAVTCTPKVIEYSVVVEQTGSPVKADYTFTPQCSDGTGRVTGTVYDMLADHRAAQLEFWIDDWTGSSFGEIDYNKVVAPNGAGTSTSFSKVTKSPGSVGWRLRIKIRACSTGGLNCSTPGNLSYVG